MTTPPAPAVQIRVRLYVADDAPNSVAAIANLRAALAPCPGHTVELEIIDVVAAPERGLRDGILVTPMLVVLAPVPERRILGNLQNRELLLTVLGLRRDEP